MKQTREKILSLTGEILKYKEARWNDTVKKLQLKLMCSYFPKMTHEEMLVVNKALD